MADYFNPNEFRLSSSAFMWGDLVFTDYKTGCLRKILLQSRDINAPYNGVQTDDPDGTTLGDVNENRHIERLYREGHKKFLREVEFKRPIPQEPTITSSGHCDFIIANDINAAFVDELKSATSKNTRRNVIKNGEYSTENLAQIVAYMGEAKLVDGRLIYTYYEIDTNTGKYHAIDSRTFIVKIDDYGKIFVDGKATQWAFNDLIAHRVAAARVIRTGEVTQRPYRWELEWASPCKFCHFKDACDKFDSGEIEGDVAFVEYAKNLIEREIA